VSINAGGPATGAFLADGYFSGGDTFSTSDAIDTSLLTGDAPPASVLQTERYGDFTYTIPNRAPGTAQTVTLFFQESYWSAAGQRTFDVAINGSTVMTAFDIFASAGGTHKAIAKTFSTTADPDGKVAIRFIGTGPDHPKVCAITVAGEGTAPTPDGGSSSGGSSSGGSSSGGSPDPVRSAGCGSTNGPRTGTYTINAAGLDRTYILDVPADYDPNKAYRLVFAWHPRGGNARGIADGDGGYYGLKPLSGGSAIFVAGEGIDAGWANSDGRDIAFTRAMVERLESQLCIDKGRIFSMGWSFGGMFSFAIGCELADVFRAIGPASGALLSGCAQGSHPVAMWGAHGTYDSLVSLDSGRGARDVILARNHCSTATSAKDANGCVSYQGCDAGYPVVWCEWPGGHTYPEFARPETWKFFAQF
jgi:poly(3-hydroxybutyrate) depolymerase